MSDSGEKVPAIRPIAVGIPIRDGHVLALEGHDAAKGLGFYRAIGGGVEFGETAEAAVRREFVEELGVTLAAVTLLGVVENIFEYEGAPGHEIAFVFAVDSDEIDRIPLEAALHVLDEGSPIRWVQAAALGQPLYPEGVESMLGAEISRRRGTTGR